MKFKQDPDANDSHDRKEFGKNSTSKRDRESDKQRSRKPKRRRDDGYNRDGDIYEQRMASSYDRRPNSSSGNGNTSYAEPLDVKIEDDESANECCTYICELPDNVTKDSLIRFICQRYWKVRNINPEIIACSIREYKNDACVQFRDPYHTRYAEEVLNNAKFQDFEIRVPRWEFKYLNMFKLEAYSTIKEEAEPKDNPKNNQVEGEEEDGEVEAPKGPVASTYDKYSPIGYFKERQKTDKSIYVYNLPPKLKHGDLKKFIVQQFGKRRESKPEFAALHLRSLDNDACVEFKTTAHANVAVDILDCRVIKSNQVQVKLWDPKFSDLFTKYYQDKDHRKKKKYANKENTSEIVRLANEKLDAEAKKLLTEEVESLKADNDHLRKNLSSMTRDHVKLKQDRTAMIQENEELKKQLLARDQENRQVQEKLTQAQEKNELQTKEMLQLKQELQNVHKRLSTSQENLTQAHESWQGQQEVSFGQHQKLICVKEEFGATVMKLHKKNNLLKRDIKMQQIQQVKLEESNRQGQNSTGSVKPEADVDVGSVNQQKVNGVKEEIGATQRKLQNENKILQRKLKKKQKKLEESNRQQQNLTGSVRTEAVKAESNDVNVGSVKTEVVKTESNDVDVGSVKTEAHKPESNDIDVGSVKTEAVRAESTDVDI
jgi:hypothetical protein